MSEELDQAKQALAHAREINDTKPRNEATGMFQHKADDIIFQEALTIASVKARIAQAAALESIAAAAIDIIGVLTRLTPNRGPG